MPSQNPIAKELKNIAWKKVVYDNKTFVVQTYMEIYFGSIGKLYAVDQKFLLINLLTK